MPDTNMILFVVNEPPPYHGSAIMNSHLLNYFRRNNLAHKHLKVDSSKSHKELGKFRFGKLTNALSICLKIIFLHRSFSTAYLVMPTKGFAFYRHSLFVFLLLLKNRKVVLHLRVRGFKQLNGLKKSIVQSLFKRCYLVQHSALNRPDIDEYNFKKLFQVANGWPDVYYDYKRSIKRVKGQLDIIFLSNLFKSKGIFVLLEAIEQLKDQLQNCTFHFVGNWNSEETESEFHNYIHQYDLEEFIGHVGPKYNQDKYKFLKEMDILVFPTYYKMETWGNVILEAMMFKIPVIASNLAAIPDMIKEGQNGFLTEPKNSHQLSDRLLQLVESEQLRIEMGEKGRQIFEQKFTIDKFEKNMQNVFNQVALS